ncbi:hypothetical protein HOP50_11g61820 [Chloropicon primus]|uniref:Cilia- and flagella-associated protein 53 n=1 Tax=Chloropicon primus TaxID=1764295 RepID=A0A5B8MVV4_9CHLO|nr:hypothetical protein A3770_11p61600 [Chloropicon primus]UPR02855.1 hypothetical protein HOP50_11g61820 [Chloropicon primus]|eukprot:QDZ23642.1 hypothetical protein A3770_11p61600 [Chloropicon primus]
MQDIVKYNEKRGELALWEQKTDANIKKNEVRKRYEAIMARAEHELEDRRLRLRSLLQLEQASLQQELESQRVNPAEYRKMRAEKARKLAQAREMERQQLASELIMKQWKEGCDPLRHLESKQLLMNVVKVQKQQLLDKGKKEKEEQEKDAIFDLYSEQARAKQEQKEKEDQALRLKMDEEAKLILDQQVKERTKQREYVEEVRQMEIADLKSKWADEAEQQKKQDLIQHHKNQALGEELRAFNTMKQNEAKILLEKEREEDRRIVQEAIAKAKEDEQKEKEISERQRDDARKYREHLKIQMQKEHEDETERDILIAQAEKEQWAKIEAVRKAQEDARNKLMEEVIESRNQQIAKKRNDKMMELHDREKDRVRILDELQTLDEIEKESLARVKAERKQHQLDIQAQIVAKEVHRDQTRKFEELEHELALESERKYKSIIDNLLQNQGEPNTYFGRKTSKWYT